MSPARLRDSARRRANAQLADRALRRGAGFAFHRPVEVYLQVASACNLDCYMCSEHNRPAHMRRGYGLESMSPEIFARVEEEILPWSSRLCLGIGGEPTISERFAEYVRRSASAGQEIHLTTNGTRFEHGEVAEVVANHVSFVQVSLDAASARTYERIRLGSRWERMLRGLERFDAMRTAAPAGQRCHLTLCFVLMRSNVHELPAFLDFARQARADAVRAQHVIPVTEEGGCESLLAEPELFNRLRDEALSRARSLGLPLEIPRPYPVGGRGVEPELALPDSNGTLDPSLAWRPRPPQDPPASDPLAGHAIPCYQPNQSIYVLYDGRVFPCCHPFAHQKMQMGDLRVETFGEIWNRRLYRNLRAGLRSGDVPEVCSTCSIVHSPPPAPETLAALADSPDLAEHYGARDLEPEPERAGAWAAVERAGWVEYVTDLRQHADNLEGHLGHIANLEREQARLVRESDALRKHGTDLERERDALRKHATDLERERDALRKHAMDLEPERDELRKHAGKLESERAGLARHAANLAAERPHLVGHIANLERERGWRGVVRQVARGLDVPRLRGSSGQVVPMQGEDHPSGGKS